MNVGNSSKYIKYLFATVFALMILSTGSVSVFTGNQTTDFSVTNTAHAQEGTTYTFMQNVDLPGFGGSDGTITVSDQSFATYVNGLIQVAIGFAILLSVIMVIAGGAEYMGARSVTNKDDAQDRIGKAIGGLLLALSAVVILQTINPNLIELNPLSEVNVEGEDINVGAGGTDDPEESGMYYCFDADTTTGGLTAPDSSICEDTKSECQNVKNNGGYDVTRDSCRLEVYYKDGSTYFTGVNNGDTELNESSDYCVGYRYNSESKVTCYEEESVCTESDLPGERKTECRTPDDFENIEVGGETVTYQSSGTLIGDSGAFVGDELYNATGTGEATNITIAKEQAKNECENKLMDYAGKDESNGGTDVCDTGPSGLFGCTIDGCGTAEQVGGNNLVSGTKFACQRNEDDLYDACTQDQVRECQNCDTLDSFGLTDHFRSPPNLCHPDYATIDGNQCEINSGLAGKLQNLKTNLNAQSTDVFWRMTEAWPPTLRHASQCHAVGTCVDIALRKNSAGERWVNGPESATAKHVNQINSFIESAENAGLSVTYEVGSEELLNLLKSGSPSVPADKIINIGVAPHFSVYRSASDR